MRAHSLTERQLLDIEKIVCVVKNLNNALFMACLDIGDMNKTNALQAVIDEIYSRLEILDERLEEIREDLK